MYITVVLTICKLLWNRLLEFFHLAWLILHLLNNNSPFTLGPHSLATTILFSIFMSSVTVDSSHRWNCAVFTFLWLAYFPECNVPKVYPCCSMWQNFLPCFLRLINIPLYVRTTFTCQWTFKLLPHLDYCEKCCNEHECANTSLRACLQFFWI